VDVCRIGFGESSAGVARRRSRTPDRGLENYISSPGRAYQSPETTRTSTRLRFRPLLFFDSQEKWRPLNINEFLAEGTRYGFDHHHWCGNADATTCAPILDASSLRTYSDGNRFDDRIDIAGEPGGASSDYT
jgi:hypothetical protein